MKIFFALGDINEQNMRGTENYVLWLAKGLIDMGFDISILCPANKINPINHKIQNVPVIRFGPINDTFSKKELQSIKPPNNLDDFTQLCKTYKPDIIHFHSLTTGLGIFHAESAKKYGIKLLFTSHVPHFICPIGTYVRKKEQCIYKCGSKCQYCIIRQKSNEHLANLVDKTFLKRLTGYLPGKFSFPRILRKRLKRVVYTFDYIISPAKWQIGAIKNNQFNTSNLIHIPQGINSDLISKSSSSKRVTTAIKVGYIGAIHPIKGIQELLSTFDDLERKDILLEIVGSTDNDLSKYLMKKYNKNNQIIFMGYKKGTQLKQWFNSLDVMILPSACCDMAPLTLVEALALKIPVIGSNIGGIPEILKDGENGKLFNPFNQEELKNILLNLSIEDIETIRRNMTLFDRTFNDVLTDNLKLYKQLLAE